MPFKHPRSKNWYITWTEAGEQRTRSSRTTDFQEAKRLENKLRSETHFQPVTTSRTINEVLEQYLIDKPSERTGYAVKQLLAAWDNYPIESIKPPNITEYKRSRGVSDSTLSKELGVLRTAIRHCNKQLGWNLPEVTKGRIPKENKGRIRWITQDEARNLVGSVTARAEYLKDFIVLSLHTGLRKQELLNLTWNRVDLANRVIHFNPPDHKSETYATVPINETATDTLKRIKSDNSLVFYKKDGSKLGDIKKPFRTACIKAGIKDFKPHDLRHTCASWLVQAGVPIVAVKEIMRHSEIETTMRYAHLAPVHAKAGVSELDEWVK